MTEKPKDTCRTINATLSDGSKVKCCVAFYLRFEPCLGNKKRGELPYVVEWEYAD
jgi:hypothetical protein